MSLVRERPLRDSAPTRLLVDHSEEIRQKVVEDEMVKIGDFIHSVHFWLTKQLREKKTKTLLVAFLQYHLLGVSSLPQVANCHMQDLFHECNLLCHLHSDEHIH